MKIPSKRADGPVLVDYVDHWADQCADHPAAIQGSTKLSYRQLRRSSERCAEALLEAGVKRGDRVAMLTTPRLEFLIVYLALARTGAVWVGLNPRHKLRELSLVVEDTDPKILFGLTAFETRDYTSDLQALQEGLADSLQLVTIGGEMAGHQTFEQFLASADESKSRSPSAILENISRSLPPTDPRFIVYTSGSTGRPKGAVIAEQGLMTTQRYIAGRCANPDFRTVIDFPIDHVSALACAYMSLINAGTVYLRERFEAAGLVDLMERERITCWCPEIVQVVLVSDYVEGRDFPHLDSICYAGVPSQELLEKMQSMASDVFTGFGMTETSEMVMATAPDTPAERLLSNSIGHPIPGVALRLWSDADAAQSRAGEVGEIQIRGDCVLLEYFGRPEATAESFTADGWFRTGDLAREFGDGTYQLIGRAGETFRSGGYNIYPREIEIVMESHPAVARVGVVSVPDPIFQATGYAFVLLKSGKTASSDELDAHARSALANYKVPKHIEVLEALPLTRTDKVDKAALRPRALEALGLKPEQART
jgi:acyl-CoA synthetase (AMP-forming)/AMP-acid ligase II